MLREFAHFHPNVSRTVQKATEVTRWPFSVHDPLSKWSQGKILLIGDAAHPVLPFGGQGSNQAIEDAGALGSLLHNIETDEDLRKKLEFFDKVRRKRASRAQVLGKVRIGKEHEVREELSQYADPLGSAVPGSFVERTVHDYGFNVFERCSQVLEEDASLREHGCAG